jgi:hypothetical protein
VWKCAIVLANAEINYEPIAIALQRGLGV